MNKTIYNGFAKEYEKLRNAKWRMKNAQKFELLKHYLHIISNSVEEGSDVKLYLYVMNFLFEDMTTERKGGSKISEDVKNELLTGNDEFIYAILLYIYLYDNQRDQYTEFLKHDGEGCEESVQWLYEEVQINISQIYSKLINFLSEKHISTTHLAITGLSSGDKGKIIYKDSTASINIQLLLYYYPEKMDGKMEVTQQDNLRRLLCNLMPLFENEDVIQEPKQDSVLGLIDTEMRLLPDQLKLDVVIENYENDVYEGEYFCYRINNIIENLNFELITEEKEKNQLQTYLQFMFLFRRYLKVKAEKLKYTVDEDLFFDKQDEWKKALLEGKADINNIGKETFTVQYLGRVVASLTLMSGEDNIPWILMITRAGQMRLEYLSDIADWQKKVSLILQKLEESNSKKEKYSSDFKYSYLFLSGYRGLDKLDISFDHKYKYDEGTKSLSQLESGSSRAYFYGKTIYSCTCLVGKNGDGKTSIVDFLKESFFKIKKDIDGGFVSFKDGAVVIEEEKREYYGISEKTEFLVVFWVAGQYQIITNIRSLKKPGHLNEYGPGMTLKAGFQEITIAYYSLMRFRYMVRQEERNLQDHVGDDDREYLKYAMDLSEETFDAARRDGNDLNLDLLYQLVFLRECCHLNYFFEGEFDRNKLELYAVRNNKRIIISKALEISARDEKKAKGESYEREGEPHQDGLQEISVDELRDIINKAVLDPWSYIRPFSSGEYSRFVLLARLYWTLKGGDIFRHSSFWEGFNFLSSLNIERNNLRSSLNYNIIAQEDSAVLFFDEGDLFYHPNWQRRFMDDIFKMVEICRINPVQIIFTTNSPFMLSDMRKEDVFMLAKGLPHDFTMNTFGQNIHMLLASRFFMSSTIGYFAEKRIRDVADLLEDPTYLYKVVRNYNETHKSPMWTKKGSLRKNVKIVGYLNDRINFADLEKKRPLLYQKIRAIDTKDWQKDGDLSSIIKERERRFVESQVSLLFDRYIEPGEEEKTIKEFIDNIGESVIKGELRALMKEYLRRVGHGMGF